jgi:hypothetical protein
LLIVNRAFPNVSLTKESVSKSAFFHNTYNVIKVLPVYNKIALRSGSDRTRRVTYNESPSGQGSGYDEERSTGKKLLNCPEE